MFVYIEEGRYDGSASILLGSSHVPAESHADLYLEIRFFGTLAIIILWNAVLSRLNEINLVWDIHALDLGRLPVTSALLIKFN